MTAKIGSTIGTNDTAAAIENTRDLVNNGLDTLESGIEKLREAAPIVRSLAASQV